MLRRKVRAEYHQHSLKVKNTPVSECELQPLTGVISGLPTIGSRSPEPLRRLNYCESEQHERCNDDDVNNRARI